MHEVSLYFPFDDRTEHWINVAGTVMAAQFGVAQAAVGGVAQIIDRETGDVTLHGVAVIHCEPEDLTAADMTVVVKLAEMLKAVVMADGIAVVFDGEITHI